MVDYDRKLIAEMLDEYAACRSADLRHTRAAIAEQVNALLAADNAEAAGVHTATQPPAVGVDVSDEMVERLVDDIPRQRELARRLIASGPKAAHVSCSETHEISEFVDDACDYIERVAAALRTGGGA